MCTLNGWPRDSWSRVPSWPQLDGGDLGAVPKSPKRFCVLTKICCRLKLALTTRPPHMGLSATKEKWIKYKIPNPFALTSRGKINWSLTVGHQEVAHSVLEPKEGIDKAAQAWAKWGEIAWQRRAHYIKDKGKRTKHVEEEEKRLLTTASCDDATWYEHEFGRLKEQTGW